MMFIVDHFRYFCNEVEMSPSQCNEVIEDKLSHLEPVLKCVLASIQHVEHLLSGGEFNWRKAFSQAKENVSGE